MEAVKLVARHEGGIGERVGDSGSNDLETTREALAWCALHARAAAAAEAALVDEFRSRVFEVRYER